MKNTKRAFTLVELVVVITILAILGTIAFISLQWYSSDARNSKRTSDLKNIEKAMSMKLVNGSNLLGLIADTSSAWTFSIAGKDGATDDYKAGKLSYSAMGIKEADFKDPSTNNDYPAWVTRKKEGQFEIAASMENGSGDKSALVMGTYVPRSNALAITPASAFSGTNSVTLKDIDINKIKRGDYIVNDGANNATVTSVSRNGKVITLNGTLTWATIKLAVTETEGLIDEKGLTGNPVVNSSTSYLPY